MRTITCFGDRKLRMCCHTRWPALEVRAAIVSYINSSFQTILISAGKSEI